jgi:hypothetical protein
MVELNIRSTDFVDDIERTSHTLPDSEDIEKALARGVKKTAQEFAERVNELAPESDTDEYDRSYGDHPPSVIKLSNSFITRSHGSSPFAYEVISFDDDRAYLLEVGDDGAFMSAEFSEDPDEGPNTLAIYAPNHEDANEDGRIFRQSAERTGIEPRFYIKEAFEEFRTQRRLEQNVQEEIDKVI